MNINIIITDDHPMIISGLAAMIANAPHMHIMATYSNGIDLLAGLKSSAPMLPDVLLIDIQMPGMTGNQLARTISQKYPQISMLAITNMNTTFHVNDMLTHGCRGYLLKNTSTENLLKAIEEVYKGHQFIDDALKEVFTTGNQDRKNSTAVMTSLTRREKEILQLIVDGHTNQEISEKLFLSSRTVESHRFSLQQKLNVKNMVELIKLALKEGLV